MYAPQLDAMPGEPRAGVGLCLAGNFTLGSYLAIASLTAQGGPLARDKVIEVTPALLAGPEGRLFPQ